MIFFTNLSILTKNMSASKQLGLLFSILLAIWFFVGTINHKNNLKSPQKLQQTEKAKQKYLSNVKLQVFPSQSFIHQRYIKQNGIIRLNRNITIKNDTNGIVTKIFKKEGDYVKKGETILQLDIREAKVSYEKARTALVQAKRNYKVSQQLFKDKLISSSELEQTKINYSEAQVQVETTKINLQAKSITAPFDGFIDNLLVKQGDLLTTPGIATATFVDYNSYIARVYLTPEELEYATVGKKASIVLSNDETIPGEIYYISKIANENTRTVAVDIKLNSNSTQKTQKLREGLQANISFTANRVSVHFVKSSDLSFENNKLFIKAIKSDIIQAYPVTIIEETDTGILVSGLPNKINIISLGHKFALVGKNANQYKITKVKSYNMNHNHENNQNKKDNILELQSPDDSRL